MLADAFAGATLDGYEIHMGVSQVKGDHFCRLENGGYDGCWQGNVFGTYLHGLFDTGQMADRLMSWLCARKGIDAGEFQAVPHEIYVQQQYDRRADLAGEALDVEKIYGIMERYKERKR